MADIVGLRFVTTGEKDAIQAYERYKRGLLDLDQVQNKHVAAFNRRAREERAALQATARAAEQAARQQARAIQQQDAEARKALQNRLRYDREKEQAAARAARAAEQAARQQARAIQQQDAEARRAFQQYLRYQQEKERAAERAAREIEQAAEREARAQRQAAQETARLRQSYNQLLASIDPVIARQQRTRQTVDMLRAAVAAGAITTAQAAQALNQYRNSLRQMDVANQIATRGMNRFGVLTQQAGYQVGDFVVQIQSGTNVMVALGQQATQLIGTFAMLARTTRMIAIFSGLGVVVPILTAIGAAMMRTSGASDTLEQKLQKLEESGNKLETTLNRLEDTELDQKFGNLADEVFEISEAMLALDQSAQLNNLMGVLDRVEDAASAGWFRMMDAQMAQGVQNLRAFFNPFESMVGAADVTERENEKAFGKLGFDMARSQFLSYTEELQRLAQAGDTAGVVEAFNRFIQDATDNGAELSMTGIALAASMERSALATAEIAARLNGSAQAAKDAADAEKRRQEALRADADAFASHVAAYREEQIAAAEAVANRQAALLEENTRFEEEQARKRAVAQAKGDAARIAAINLYYDNLEKAEAERERVDAARAEIRRRRAEEEAALQKAMDQQVADQQAALLEENARYERASRAQVENFNAQKLSLQEQLALTQEISLYGRDSAEVRALRLEQEIAARKRSIDAQVAENRLSAEHGSLIKALVEELLRAEAAAESTKDEVAGIGPALQSAIDQANAFASAMGRARAESAGIGISTAGLQAQAEALEGGASRAEATARGAAATLRERLIAEAGGTVGRGTGMRIEQQVAERFDAVLQRELAQERVRALTATPSGGTSSAGSAAQEQEDYLQNLLLEAEQKRRLVGLDEEETRRREILFELKKRELPLDDDRIEQIIQTEAETRKLIEAEQQREQLMQTIEGNIKSAFMTMVDGSASVEDAFRNMLRNIILAIYEQKVAQPAAEAIGSLIETGISALFKADGGAFNRGVEFYANGGVVNAPTGFRHSGGLGVMGEAGPEAIMPLKRGKDGKLGVQAEGGGAVVVNNYFNMSANGDESVKRIIRGEMPRIAEATKAAVVDAKRRGGSYGRSF